MNTRKVNKNDRAKEKVQKLKGFYKHLMLYVVINTILLGIKIIGNYYYGDYFMGPLWHFSTFASWVFWGIGLSFHAIKVFNKNLFFSEAWEEQKIAKYMKEGQSDVEKYN